MAGGAAAQVTTNGGVVAFESVDGAYLYYTQTHSAPSALWRMPTKGGSPEKVLDGVGARGFQVCAQGVYYVERYGDTRPPPSFQTGIGLLRSDSRARLRFFDFSRRTSKILAEVDQVAIGLGMSPDARTILFTRVDNMSSNLMMVEDFR